MTAGSGLPDPVGRAFGEEGKVHPERGAGENPPGHAERGSHIGHRLWVFIVQYKAAILFTFLGLTLIWLAQNRLPSTVSTSLGFGALGSLDVPARATIDLLGAMMVLSSAGSFLLSRTQWRELRPSYLLWLATALGSLAILVAAAQGNQIDLVGMLAQSIRLATPIALGALAGIYCERSGVINIAIEGMMLTAACFGILGNLIWGNIWAGLGLAVVSAMVIALLHAVLSIKFKTNQIVSGTVLNILAVGITGFVRRTWLLQTGGREVFPILPIPVLSRIPVIGEMFFNNGPMVYAMFILMIVTQVVLFHTVWGLRTRAVGEHPRAADTVGINVYWVRYANVIVSGLIAGLGGAWFSLETTGGFDDNMTNGKGFIALAAMIFGKWTPFGAMSGAMLFGFADAVQFKFQILNVPVPYQFLSIIPYVVTIIVLTGVMGRAIPPAAVGKPYEK